MPVGQLGLGFRIPVDRNRLNTLIKNKSSQYKS